MQKKVQLRRTLGLFEVTLSGIGVIHGAGIYALIGEAAGLAGNAVWISFALSAVVAIFTGLSYAELASMFPKASAEYEYTSQAFGPFPAFVIGWLIIFSGVIGAATVSLGFAGYFQASALIFFAFIGFEEMSSSPRRQKIQKETSCRAFFWPYRRESALHNSGTLCRKRSWL